MVHELSYAVKLFSAVLDTHPYGYGPVHFELMIDPICRGCEHVCFWEGADEEGAAVRLEISEDVFSNFASISYLDSIKLYG